MKSTIKRINVIAAFKLEIPDGLPSTEEHEERQNMITLVNYI